MSIFSPKPKAPDPAPIYDDHAYVIRTDTHFLTWVDEYGENSFHVSTIRPTIGWGDDINVATIMDRHAAESRIRAFPPGSARIAKVTRIEVDG